MLQNQVLRTYIINPSSQYFTHQNVVLRKLIISNYSKQARKMGGMKADTM